MWKSMEKKDQATLTGMRFYGDKKLVTNLKEVNKLKESHDFDWVVDDYGQDTVSSQCVLTEELLKEFLVGTIFEKISMKERTNGPLCSSYVLQMVLFRHQYLHEDYTPFISV